MRTVSLSVLLLLAGASAPALAQSGFFVAAAAGDARAAEPQVDDRTHSAQLSAGYRWGSVGVELGNVRVAGLEQNRLLPTQRYLLDLDVSGWTFGLHARRSLSPRSYVSWRAGVLRWQLDTDARLCGLPDSATASDCIRNGGSESGTDFHAGAGIGYDLTRRFSLGLAYDFYRIGLADRQPLDGERFEVDSDIGSVTLSAELRF
jgi:OmpA-OmpF porin, OOP family